MLNDEIWLSKLAYVADIFDRLNLLNTGLQGPNTTVFAANDKISAFKKKLVLLSSEVSERDCSAFPNLSGFLEENDVSLNPEVISDFITHLDTLKVNFSKYFPGNYSNFDWIRNPFSATVPKSLSTAEKESFIDLTSDSALKDAFQVKPLLPFWMAIKSQYPSLFKKAISILMAFVTSYCCESAFSELLYIKNKYRNRISVEEDLRVKVSSIEPDIASLTERKQQQVSH